MLSHWGRLDFVFSFANFYTFQAEKTRPET